MSFFFSKKNIYQNNCVSIDVIEAFMWKTRAKNWNTLLLIVNSRTNTRMIDIYKDSLIPQNIKNLERKLRKLFENFIKIDMESRTWRFTIYKVETLRENIKMILK